MGLNLDEAPVIPLRPRGSRRKGALVALSAARKNTQGSAAEGGSGSEEEAQMPKE